MQSGAGFSATEHSTVCGNESPLASHMDTSTPSFLIFKTNTNSSSAKVDNSFQDERNVTRVRD